MRFNDSKCYIMPIHRTKFQLIYRYSLNNHILEQLNENPYFGLTISDNLKWSSQINKMCNKTNSTLGFITRNLKYCNKKFKETAYISGLVHSLLDYSASVWDPYLQKDIERIESIQRRGATFVQKDYQRASSVTSTMNELGCRPLAHQRREQRLTLLFKIINDLVAIPATNHIVFNTRPPRSEQNKQIKVMFCCMLLYVYFSIAIILMGKRELIALLNLSSWCLVMVERLFLTVPRGCLQFVIVVFPDLTHLLFFITTNTDIYKNSFSPEPLKTGIHYQKVQ